MPPLEILLTLEKEVENEEEGWWLWLASGCTLLRDEDDDKEADPGGASVVPSMLTSPGGARNSPSGPPRPFPLCVCG